MDQFRHKIIEESWSKKGLRDYLLVLRKEDHPASEQYILSFFEKLFALLVTSYMSQDLERGDNYCSRLLMDWAMKLYGKPRQKYLCMFRVF